MVLGGYISDQLRYVEVLEGVIYRANVKHEVTTYWRWNYIQGRQVKESMNYGLLCCVESLSYNMVTNYDQLEESDLLNPTFLDDLRINVLMVGVVFFLYNIWYWCEGNAVYMSPLRLDM